MSNETANEATPVDTEEVTDTTSTTEVPAEPQSDTDTQEETVEQFGRDYVEKLRRESAGYRERATTAETTVAALQQQHAERLIDAAGVKPAAVFALTRRESPGYRDRAPTAETTVAALRQQHAERLIDAAGVKPAAVFALTTITDLLADDGTVDPEKVTAAVTRARQELGVTGRPQPLRPQGGLTSGTGAPKVQNTWQSAFAPPER
ncbi:hypothetical protein [Mycolicibacter icosiumassiliensis]|uniref:hypothetical protein n=1 Tax=Mycolicibacter icosiumassiliensis TaxID=1792835 RepID=UPI000830D085|nr:hypothetical protein [Mycolicibacter icosiumassiliensis]